MGLEEALLESDKAIRFIKRSSIGTPRVMTIDLTTAQTDLLLQLTGNFFYVIDASDDTAAITVKFNEQRENGVPLEKQVGLITPFHRVYLTHAAQANVTVTILYGTLAPQFLNVIDNRSSVSGSIDAVRDELRGDTAAEEEGARVQLSAEGQVLAANSARKGFGVCNPVGNDLMFLRFGAAVVTATTYAMVLEGGATAFFDDYRGVVRALANTSGQFLHYWEW